LKYFDISQSLEQEEAMKKKGAGVPRATVRKVNGVLVLDDPDALAVAKAVSKHNCGITLGNNSDRVAHFKNRAAELGKTADEVVIVVLNVDDEHGGAIAEKLMPGANWQSFHDQGQVPFARGLAGRKGIQDVLRLFDKEAAKKLRGMKDLAVVVVDYGVAEIFQA
jgi:hypothetical protein